MAKHLNAPIGEMEYDNLISGMIPPVKVASGTIAAQEEDTEFKRGTVMCLGSDGTLSMLGGSSDGGDTGDTGDTGDEGGSGSSSATPYCILCDNETVGTEETVVPVYVMGCFNPAALIMEDGYELTQDDIDALRMRGIYLSAILD